MSTSETVAIRIDAEQRLIGLRIAAARLWPHQDDPNVLSELTSVLSQLRAAEREVQR